MIAYKLIYNTKPFDGHPYSSSKIVGYAKTVDGADRWVEETKPLIDEEFEYIFWEEFELEFFEDKK